MYFKTISLLCLSLVLGSTLSANAETPSPPQSPANGGRDGEWWGSLTGEQKASYVLGVVDGVALQLKLITPPLARRHPATFEKDLYECFRMMADSIVDANIQMVLQEPGPIVAGVDEFFSVAERRRFSTVDAVTIVLLRRSGRSDEEIQEAHRDLAEGNWTGVSTHRSTSGVPPAPLPPPPPPARGGAGDPRPVDRASAGDLPLPEPPKIIRVSGRVLAGKAIETPQPTYPEMAKAAGLAGDVVVEVTVDVSGNVVSARAVSGHPLLRDAAVRAARSWTFTPTTLSGHEVMVIGTITFEFELPETPESEYP